MDSSPRPVDLGPYLARRSDAEQELRRLFYARQELTIFDVGACEGEDTIRYAHRFPCSRVFAFEPLPPNQQLIRANLERYAVRNAEVISCAVSDRAGTADFHVSSGRPPELHAGDEWNYGNKSSSLLPPAQPEPMFGWIQFNQRITVPTTTIAAFCADRRITHIDFIHMDVQGAEMQVLLGAGSLLDHTVAVWLEVSEEELYRGQALRPQIEDLMRRRGFRLTSTVRRGIEGDQFYVNRRFPRTWPYLLARCVRALARSARLRLGEHTV